MFITKFCSNTYRKLYKREGFKNRFYTPFRVILRAIANKSFNKKRQDIPTIEKKIEGLMVSLTSFPGRIKDVSKVIESLLYQSYQPEKIILWLSKEEFQNITLPNELLDMQSSQFEIKFVDENFLPHNKYFHAIKKYKQYNIITIDDDIYYQKDMIKDLIETAKYYPNCIITNKGHKITFSNNKINPYKDWVFDLKPLETSENIILLGYGGVYYPANIMPELLLEKEKFMKLSPKADDLWLNAVAKFYNIKIIKSKNKYIDIDIFSNSPKLSEENHLNDKNDIYLQNIIQYFSQNYNVNIFENKDAII